VEVKFWSPDIAFPSLHFKDNVYKVDKTFKARCQAVTANPETHTDGKVQGPLTGHSQGTRRGKTEHD